MIQLRHVLAASIAATLALPAFAAPSAPLFSPLPLASMQRAGDATLASILAEPANRFVARVQARADLVDEKVAEIRLNLSPGIDIVAARTHAETVNDGIVTWAGSIAGDGLAGSFRTVTGDAIMDAAAGEVVLVRNGDRLTGSIRVQGELYALRPVRSGGHAIYRVDTMMMPADHPADFDASALYASHENTATAATAMDGNTTHAMIVFSKDAMESTADPVGLAHLAVAETNQGYANSGIHHRLTMIDTVYASDYRDSKQLGVDLSALASTNDGALDWIHQRRNEKQADLVTLIVGQGGDACGVGYLNSSAGSAFTVADKGCAVGYYSYGHELGHNYGATHNPQAGRNGTYAYGHGYYNQAARARTVMSYDCQGGCTRYNVWSSPRNRINGVIAGNAHESDNVRVLNERASTVARFR